MRPQPNQRIDLTAAADNPCVMDRLKNLAEAYRLGVIGGIFPISQVIAWADAEIEASDAPSSALIELSLSGRKGPAAVVSALGDIPGSSDRAEVTVQLSDWMYRLLLADSKMLRAITQTLEQMALEGVAPDEHAAARMQGFDDMLSVAESGVYGTPANVRSEVIEFLQSHRSSTAT